METKTFDLIIVGGGPAGMTAAIYATRSNLSVLVIDHASPGGQVILTSEIDNYPGFPLIAGFELANKLTEHATKLGAEFVFDNITRIDLNKQIKTIVTEYSGTFNAKAVILCTGAKPRTLNVQGEDKFVGRGISFCATCDGAFYKEKIVAVVGGGNSAVEEAIMLSKTAKKVYIFHMLNDFQANKVLQNQLSSCKNIEVHFQTTISKCIGDKKLESVEVLKKGIQSTFEIDGLFIAIGRIPNTDFVKNQIEVDRFGYVVSNEMCHTNLEGVFVAGDVRQKSLRQIVTACSDGAIASDEANKYLQSKK